MIHSTRAIVLRTVKYGETSFIVTLYTELFGIQSCMVQGVRKASKKGNSKAGFFSVGAQLQIAMYHQGNKQLQRISDYQFDAVHTSISTSVVKNAIVVLMMEGFKPPAGFLHGLSVEGFRPPRDFDLRGLSTSLRLT